MEKKKILIVSCTGLANGGVQAVVMSIVRNLSHKYLFDIICFTTDDYYKEEFESYGGKVYLLPYKSNRFDYYLRYRRYLKKMVKILRENGPYSAIHAHNYFESAIALDAARRAGVQIRIAHSHNTAVSNNARSKLFTIYNSIYRKLIGKYSTVRIGCSRGACEYLFGDKSSTVVHNAIDLEKYNIERFPLKQNDGVLRMFHVGRYCDQKNQLFLLDVFNEYVSRFGNAHLTMVGFGALENEVKDKINKLGLNGRVEMLPSDTDIPKIMSENDILVFPSKFEGLGIVLIEAQAMGMRCFVSDAVPNEADLGNLIYIPLAEGADKWALTINDYIEKNGSAKNCVDMSSYDLTNVIDIYDRLYSGEKI